MPARRSSITERFGSRVRDLRRQRGLSQEDFALQVGLDRTYVSGIERGVRNVSLVNLDRIAQSLGLSLADLFASL